MSELTEILATLTAIKDLLSKRPREIVVDGSLSLDESRELLLASCGRGLDPRDETSVEEERVGVDDSRPRREPWTGRLASVEFVRERDYDDDEAREPGTYVTVRLARDDWSVRAGDVTIAYCDEVTA